jgi:putative transposase
MIDRHMLEVMLDHVIIDRPQPTQQEPQHVCLDKAYDHNPIDQALILRGYIPHIRRIGEEKLDAQRQKTHPARRWVVERTFAWLRRCRAIIVRYDRKAENYIGLIALACALIWYRRSHRIAF